MEKEVIHKSMKQKKTNTYTVITIGENILTEDMSNYLIVSCSNQKVVERITGISENKLVYNFTKLKKKSLREKGYFIIKTDLTYKGEQEGGLRNPALLQRGNNY